MRLAIISDASAPTPAPGGHGLGRACSEIAERLHTAGHDVTLFATTGSRFSGTLEMPVEPGADYHKREGHLAHAAYAKHLEQPFDVVYDHSHLHGLSKFVPNAPIVSHFHDKFQEYRRCAVLCSEGQRGLMPPAFASARVIHHQLDPTPYTLSLRPEKYLLYLGVFREYKQPILAIEGAAAVGIKLKIAGSLPFDPATVFSGNENCEYVGVVDGEAKLQLIRGATALLQLGLYESYGLTTVEAGLCFPHDTRVQAENVINGIESLYTGKLIKIKTDTGEFETTANHPIWTRNGWIKANDLVIGNEMLYTLGCCNKERENAKQIKEIYTGTIGSIVSRIRNNAFERSRNEGGDDRGSGALATSSGGNFQILRDDICFETHNFIRRGIGIHRGINRRRGNNHSSGDASGEGQAIDQHSQYLLSINGMVAPADSTKISLYRQETCAPFALGERLRLPNRGTLSLSPVSITPALYDHQKRTFGVDDRVDGNTPRTIENGDLYREAAIHHAMHPGAKYQSITEIETRYVTEFPVYNLTTESGTYSAEGFLVHNCGTPVVAWDEGGTRDIIRDGVNGTYIENNNVMEAVNRARTMNRKTVHEYTVAHFGNPQKQVGQVEQALNEAMIGWVW